MRNLYLTELAHLLFTFFLFFQQLTLPADVTTVTFGGNVLPQCGNRLPGNDLRPDGGLNGNGKLLTWQQFLKALTDLTSKCFRLFPVYQRRQGIDVFTVQFDIQFHQIRLAVVVHLVVKRSISPGNGFQTVVKIEYDLSQRQIKLQFDPRSG